MTDVNANIIVNIDSSAALVNLRKLETQIDQFQRRASASTTAAAASQQALNRALLDGINNTGLFSAKTVMAQDSMSRLSASIDKGKLSLGEYTRYAASQLPGMSRVFKREFDLMGQVAESRVKKMQTQYIALGKTVDGVTKAIASTPTGLAQGYGTDVALATQRQQMFNKMIDDGSTKLLNWGKNTQWAGRQLMVGFSIPMVALGAAAAKTFMEIDKATVSLKRVYGDLSTTTEELNNNVNAVKALGKQYTKYGIAVSDTIDISARAAATGATNEKLMAATEQTMRFATLGQMDYNQALDTTISLQTAFGTSNEDLGSKIDYLNAVENQTVLTMEDMSLAIPRVATVIKGLGGDVEDLAVMMTAMKEGGISAENAANGLKSGLASLINPTKRATESLASMGINIKGIVEANKGDLMGLVTDFGSAINSLDQFSRQQALEKVFGKFQFARMSALFTNITNDAGQAARAMDIAKMSTEELAKMSEKELGKISESTSVKFQAAMENLKNSVAPIGEAFLKGLTPIINVVSKIADAFNNLPGGIKNTVAVITALLAGIAPVALMGIGLLANGFANLVKTVQFFRKTIAGIKGDGAAFKWLTMGELEALSATEALEGAAETLTGKLLLQEGAVRALTAEYGRFAQVAGIAGAAMGRMGGGGAKNTGAAQRPPLRMATGGMVPGTGNKDTIPALLTPGESVITKKATQTYGPILKQMNDGTLPGFSGGFISKFFRGRTAFKDVLKRDDRAFAHLGGQTQAGDTTKFSERSNKTGEITKVQQSLRSLISSNPEKVRAYGSIGAFYHSDINKMMNQGGLPSRTLADYLRSGSVRGGAHKRGIAYGPLIESLGVSPKDRARLAKHIDEDMIRFLDANPDFIFSDRAGTTGKLGEILEDSIKSFFGNDKAKLKSVSEKLGILKGPQELRFSQGRTNKRLFARNSTDNVLTPLVAYVAQQAVPPISPAMFGAGGISIAQALKTWQTSSRAVRENPELLAALTPGYTKLKSGMRLHRGTTLGLGRGSEFNAEDEALIFNALKTGDYKSIVGREFSVSGPLSYSQTMEGTMGALTSNADVNRIEFLKAQHALGRKKHAEDLKAIKRLEANVAKGTGPVDLYTRQLAERKARVAMYPEGQKALGREIKSLAPKGYQRMQMEQQFFGRGENSLLDVNRQNMLAGQEGTFMGKNVAREQEFISPPSRIRVSGVEVDPKTGIPKLITETLSTDVPGARRTYTDYELMKPELDRRRRLHTLDRTGIANLLRDKKAKTVDLISVLSNSTFTADDLALLERNFDYRWKNGASGSNARLQAAIEEKRAKLNKASLKMATGGIVPGRGNKDTIPALLTPGESVITKEATKKYAPILHQMNNGTLPGFALGDEDIQSQSNPKRRSKAPGNIQRQGRGMTWETMAAEEQILRNAGMSTLGANAHIVPRPSLPQAIEWDASAVQRDLQEINDYVDKSKDFSEKTLENQKDFDKIVKATGLTQKQVREQLTNFSEGIHATTRESGLVLREIARLRGDSAIADVMETRLGGNYYETMSQRRYSKRGVPVDPWTVEQAKAKRGGGAAPSLSVRRTPTVTNSPGQAMQTMATQRMLNEAYAENTFRDNQKTREFINNNRNSSALRARQRRVRQSNRGTGSFRGRLGKSAGALGVASMIPFMMQDQNGQFMGMNANMLGMGMTAASMAMPIIGSKAVSGAAKGGFGLGKLAGGIAARTGIGLAAPGAGALGGVATAGMVAATGGAAAGLVALGVTAWALKKGMENTLDAGLKYADALTVSTKEQKDIAQLFGRTVLEERKLQKARSKSLNLTTAEQKMGAEFVATDPGQVMLEQAKLLTSKGADIASTIGAQLSRMIISGAVNKKQAKAIAVGLADALGKPDMAIPISLKVSNIVGPDGTNLTDKPTKIIENLKKSFEQSEKTLSASVNVAMQKNEQSWMGGSGFLGLAGDFDAMVEAQIAYTNTYLENTKQILGAIDDQITREDNLIQKLKDKKKLADTQKDKTGYQKQIAAAEAEKKALEEQRKREEAYRKQQAMNIVLGSTEDGRAQRFTGAYADLEKNTGISDIEGKVRDMLFRSGNLLGTQKGDEVQASFIVDMKLGRIDPQALAALDALSNKNKATVIPIAMRLYDKGDTQGFNDLANFGGLDPKVQDDFATLISNMKLTDDQAATVAKTLYNLADATSQQNFLDAIKSGANVLENFTEQAAKLQDLNIDVASIFSNNGIKGVALASLALDSITESMKGFKKEIDSISKQKTVAGKISKTVEVVSQIATKQGIKTNPKAVKEEIKQLADESGLKTSEVVNLPPDVLVKTLELRLKADSYRVEGKALMNAGSRSLLTEGDPLNGKEKIAQGQLLVDLANELDRGASATASAAAASSSGTTTTPPTTDNGGGSKTNYVKDMMKGFLDQAKMYGNAGLTMKQLTDSKYKFAKELLASGEANKGIIGQLRSMGLSENIIANLMSQGPEAVTQALKSYGKGGKAAVKKANIAAFRGTMSGLMLNASEGLTLEKQRTAGANMLKNKFNASPEIIQAAMQDEDFTRVINTQYVSIQERNKAIAAYIKLLKQKIEQEKINATAIDLTSSVEESFGKYASVVDSAFAAEEWRIKTAAAEEFAKANDMTVEAMQRQIVKNERLIRQEQEKIDKKQAEINGIQHSNDLIQDSIDKKRRDDEVAQRAYDAMSHQLDIMSQQEQKIRDAYDERIKALDKVASLNQHLIDQQKQQLGLADALTRGDLAAAAMAQQEMQASDAQYAVDQIRSGLQTGMENQIAGLTTEGGLTRKEAEQQIADAKERSYQVSLLIRKEEDAIYANNILIKGLNTEIYNLQNGTLKTLTDQNDAYQTKLSDYETELDYQILISSAAGYTKESWEKTKASSEAMINYLKSNQDALTAARQEWERIRVAAEGAAAASGGTAAFTASAPPGLSSTAYTNPVSVSGGQKYGGQIHYRGGLIKKYATGSFIYGDGGRDSVHARLTPGEYVMRKSAVSKYGQTMFEKMNMGAFSMPTYDLGMSASTPVQASPGVSNISAPVYNNYSVNVNVPNTNADPDAIANKVMMRITQIDSANVRSLGGNK